MEPNTEAGTALIAGSTEIHTFEDVFVDFE